MFVCVLEVGDDACVRAYDGEGGGVLIYIEREPRIGDERHQYLGEPTVVGSGGRTLTGLIGNKLEGGSIGSLCTTIIIFKTFSVGLVFGHGAGHQDVEMF